MLKTIVGQFKDRQDAGRAIKQLHKRGFDEHSVGPVVTSQHSPLKDETLQAALSGAAGGASLGSFIGLFSGISDVSARGWNPLVTTNAWEEMLGPILVGMGIGALIGGALLLTIVWVGSRRQAPQLVTENVQPAGVLVTVKTENREAAQVKRIMKQARAVAWHVT